MCTRNHAVTRDSFGTNLNIQIDSICLFIINLVSSWKNRNWYLNFGHCCLINDLGSSPQPEGEWDINDLTIGINTYNMTYETITIWTTVNANISDA